MKAKPEFFVFEWDGATLIPEPRYVGWCNKYFEAGQLYRMVELEHGRSRASHNHQFAWLRKAWAQLPEEYDELYPTPEHLRHRALIQANYYNEQIIDAGSKAAALRVAAAIRLRSPFSLVFVRGPNVIIRDAESQSLRLMGSQRFQESKQAILEIVADMIKIEPAALNELNDA